MDVKVITPQISPPLSGNRALFQSYGIQFLAHPIQSLMHLVYPAYVWYFLTSIKNFERIGRLAKTLTVDELGLELVPV